MKVDVTTPDDELENAAPEAQQAAEQPVAETPADKAHAPAEAEVLDAEYEPVEGGRGKKAKQAEEAVFSMADIEAARADAQAATDRYLRLQAEWDNYRKRTAREREEERARAAESLVTKLLPVVDDMERALDHAAKGNPEGEFGQFVDGIRGVYAKFVEAFDKTGVEAIDPAGSAFDMNEHQAVGTVDDPAVPDGTVRDVYQKGYRLGGRVIRPAMVTVTKGGPARTCEGASCAEEQPTAETASE